MKTGIGRSLDNNIPSLFVPSGCIARGSESDSYSFTLVLSMLMENRVSYPWHINDEPKSFLLPMEFLE